ncbi:MAG: ribonuclease J [Clostridia bacterium]|nr:ribonuclease J [Clostridia bacterium]
MSPAPDRHDTPSGKNRPAGLPTVPGAKLRVIPLGGLNEVGKNMTVMEYGDDIIIIDCGIGFPDEDEMPGIDLVVPDTTYLETNRNRIRGMVITHGHEDHVGAIPYILQKLDIPIYGTRLALGIIENKLQEHTLPWKADLRCVKAGDVIKLGASFTVEFIRVNHSIADACALAINTPLGMVIHSGDFKLDLTPIDGDMMDITRLGELGRAGVLLLMCESTNAERPGYTPSETKVGRSLEVIFTMHKDRRIVISTFSSNVHRVQQIINISARHGRKVAVTGRSMINIVSAAVELGYMTVPEGVLIDINDIKRYKPEELTLITTGSQGEPMSALYRMAFGEHSQVSLGWGDLVVLSASAIPGNEKLVGRIVNELSKMGVTVINDASVEVHVSGHACQEELKLMQGLTRPRYFMPVHGEYKHMAANRDLAVAMGVPESHVFISDIGKVLEIDEKGARWAGTVPSGVVLIDGLGVGDVGNIVLRDRKHLSQDGLIVVVAAVDAASGLRVAGPDIMSRGFVYVRESEELMEEIRRIAVDAIDISLRRSGRDWFEIKNTVKDDITKFLYARTGRKPMVLPIIMDV